MERDAFRCRKCGNVLRDGMIRYYRDVYTGGGAVIGGGIRCGYCQTVYSAEEIVYGVEKPSIGAYFQTGKRWWQLWK